MQTAEQNGQRGIAAARRESKGTPPRWARHPVRDFIGFGQAAGGDDGHGNAAKLGDGAFDAACF